jgi:hypothetical protein
MSMVGVDYGGRGVGEGSVGSKFEVENKQDGNLTQMHQPMKLENLTKYMPKKKKKITKALFI